MFDDVMIAVSDNESAPDALALGRALASPGAARTLVHVEQGGAELPLVVAGAPSPAAGLHNVASRGGADLLVIGTSRHRGIGRAHGEAIMRDAPCAVAVAPRGLARRAPALQRIGVGYDGSLARDEAPATAGLAADVDTSGEGLPDDALARYGASVDLLVLGPHDHGVQRASRAQRPARRPPCPLLVLTKPSGP